MSRYSRRSAKRAQLGIDLPVPVVPGAHDVGIVGVEEAVIQRAVLDLLQRHPAVAWIERMNVGAGVLVPMFLWERILAGHTPTKEEARFIRFAFEGCSDLVGQLKDGRFLGVECKRWDGKLKYEQAVFLDRVIRNKGVGFVAKSPESVQLYLR